MLPSINSKYHFVHCLVNPGSENAFVIVPCGVGDILKQVDDSGPSGRVVDREERLPLDGPDQIKHNQSKREREGEGERANERERASERERERERQRERERESERERERERALLIPTWPQYMLVSPEPFNSNKIKINNKHVTINRIISQSV